jgi:hypothetical protein
MKNIKSIFFLRLIQLYLFWVLFALSNLIFMLTMNFFNPKLVSKISNVIMWKIDGRFK